MTNNHDLNQNELVSLCTTQSVDEKFFSEIKAQAWTQFSRLECGQAYSVATLLGAEYYEDLTEKQQALAEVIMATLVMDNMLPLAFTATKGEYRLTAPFAKADDEEGVRRLTEIYYQDMPMATNTDDPEAVRAVIETFFAKLR